MIKIGLAGKMASGKTELAQYFLNHHGGQKVSFADNLKSDVVEYSLTIDGTIVKSRDRKILQDYGQFRRGEIPKIYLPDVKVSLINDCGIFVLERNGEKIELGTCESNHWLNQGIQKAAVLVKNGENVIFDDLRFVNEAEYLKKNDFVIIKVHASQSTREQRLMDRDHGFNPANFADKSEIQFDDMVGDYDISNDKNDDSAKKELEAIVAKLMK